MVIKRLQCTEEEPVLAYRRPLRGNMEAPIVVLCDPPTVHAQRSGMPIDPQALKLFARIAVGAGLVKDDILFVGLCPPMPVEIKNSDSRRWKHVSPHIEEIWELIERVDPKLIVPFGKEASRVALGRSVAITKARGKAVEHRDRLVMPCLAPSMILRVPDHEPTFIADIQTIQRLKEDDWHVSEQVDHDVEYEWREDISDILADRPAKIAVDTETTGLTWHDPTVEVLTVQISVAPGKAVVCPVSPNYWDWSGRERQRGRLIQQIRDLLGDPGVKVIGHNLKFDLHMLRKLNIEVANWSDDTQLKAFAVDENMMEKSLDECVRRWVPAMAGYADHFNQTVNKADMINVPHEIMLPYAGGDPDATLRLDNELDTLLARDPQQLKCYKLVQMPAMRTFANTVERHGMRVDQERLREFGTEVSGWLEDAYPSLIRRVPIAVRRRHAEAGKELVFSRPDFVRDALFAPDGFAIEPIVFTKTTRDLKNPEERVPSTSAKDHLPWFADPTTVEGQFCLDLIDYQKTRTLNNNFIGSHNEGNGLWQYIAPNGKIYPSYMLHRTATGRTASADPNGQNFPKRGRWAKAYQSIFCASPGFKLVNCDLSQIELRIAAWMAMDSAMLSIYRQDGDIHTATAKYVSGVSDAQWESMDPKARKELRTKAKAVNFGFLYGMGAKKFRAFAKTDYGVDYTERESYQTRERFFDLYRGLEPWHARTRDFVKANGHVRALHGAVRHLPSIWSNDSAISSGAERQAINSPVQRFGSDLGLMAMARFSAQADPNFFRIIGFVHDALVMEVRDGYEQEGINALLYAMETNPLEDWFGITPPLPIKADAEIGLNGGNLLELGDLPPVEERPEWFLDLGFDEVSATRPEWWDMQIEEEWKDVHMSL